MFAKYATAIPTGAAITFGLLFVMQALISMQSDPEIKQLTKSMNVWHHVPIEEHVNIDIFEKPPRPERLEHPDPPPITDASENGPRIPVHRSPPPTGGPTTSLADPWTSDGPLMAIVRVRPVYPAIAQQRGLEGFVRVEFDVLASGAVTNVRIIESSSAIFERSAIRAAQAFRFKARVVDGVPQSSSAVQYQFRFAMNE